MDRTSILTVVVVILLVIFGVYRKSMADQSVSYTTNALRARPNGTPRGVIDPDLVSVKAGMSTAADAPEARTTKVQLAKIVFQVEKLIDHGESIIQVHEYSSTPTNAGVQHVFDVTTFNQATTQALSKRLTCLHKTEPKDEVVLLSSQLISPITGSVVRQQSTMDTVSELLVDDADGSTSDAKFVRDKYAFIRQPDPDLPPEPRPPGPNATQADRIVYQRHLAEYRKQVEDVRHKGNFTRRRVRFAPTDQVIENKRRYPFSQPTSYGFAKAETPPIDYSALQSITPLKDEGFFNSVALEKSTLAIQYQ